MNELRLGRYQDVLADVESCDVLASDPPYSPRVHDGQRTGSQTRKSTIEYQAISPEWCSEYVAVWAPRTRHWSLTFSDHTGARWWESAWEAAGWYVFTPVLWIRSNPTPRIAGDGPTSAADYITVARPKKRLQRARVGSRPGYYMTQNTPGSCVVPGGKQIAGMLALLSDYSLPGDLVVDPCAGGGTTLLAARLLGRNAIGSEIDPATHALAAQRLAHMPPSMPGQPALFGDP